MESLVLNVGTISKIKQEQQIPVWDKNINSADSACSWLRPLSYGKRPSLQVALVLSASQTLHFHQHQGKTLHQQEYNLLKAQVMFSTFFSNEVFLLHLSGSHLG